MSLFSSCLICLYFIGWKAERIVNDAHDGRIILIRPGDAKRHWAKVHAVLDVVDATLGITGRGIRNPDQSKCFLFIADERVVGFLLAETINKATDNVSRAVLGASGTTHVLQDVDDKTKAGCLVGVSRIWVSPDYQRRKIATRLVDAMRANFLPAKFLTMKEWALTHTTPSGTDFAVKYVGSTDFLTYAPTLAGTML